MKVIVQKIGVGFFLDLSRTYIVKYAREKLADAAEKSAFHAIIRLVIYKKSSLTEGLS